MPDIKAFYHLGRKIKAAFFLSVLFAVLTFLSVLTLILCGVFVVKPTFWAKDFKNTSCRVVAHIDKGEVTCNCEAKKDCNSKYPCVLVVVQFSYKAKNGSVLQKNSTIYKDEIAGHHQDDCSVIPPSCSQYDLKNRQNVYEVINEYMIIDTARNCLYNPEDTEIVIYERVFKLSHSRLAVALPLIFFIFSFLTSGYCFFNIIDLKKELRQKFPANMDLKTMGGILFTVPTLGCPPLPLGRGAAPPSNQTASPPPPSPSLGMALHGVSHRDTTSQETPSPLPFGNNRTINSPAFI